MLRPSTKPMTRKKPLQGFRKKRRPGNKPMTKDEAARVTDAKWLACIPCWVWAHKLGNMPIEDVACVCQYDHKKSGNIRRGHKFGFASCDWHHEAIVSCDWNHAHMRSHFGPSLMDGSKLFRETYGDNDFLIELQTKLLEAP